MSDWLQQAIVGFVAAGAATVIIRRVLGAMRRPAAPSACEHCAVPAVRVAPRQSR